VTWKPVLKVAPLLLAAIAIFHTGFDPGLAADSGVGLTNVSGQAGDCTAPTRLAACATLFDGSGMLFPGGPAVERSLTVTWHGSSHPSAFGLYFDKFTSRDVRSQPGCTTLDPTDKLDLTVTQDGRLLYQGTLSSFHREHGSAPDALPLHGDSGRFTISVAMEQSADNSYMGCVSTTDLVWIASQ
jgi:hypothetical protein